MSSIGEDVGQIGPQEHPVPNVAVGPISSALQNYRIDTETGNMITEGDMTFLSGFSSSPFKQSSAGAPTSATELAHSIASFPSRLSPEGLSAVPRPRGEERAAADANIAISMDSTIAVQFVSPEVVVGQDDNMVDTAERTSLAGKRLEYRYLSPPTYSSGVEFGSTAVVRDHVVAVERSSSWEWPPAFAEGHEGDLASSATFREDDVLIAGGKLAPSPNEVPTNDDPVVVKDTLTAELTVPAVDSNDDVVVTEHTIGVKPVSPASFGGDDVVVVEDTMASEFSAPASVLDDNAVLVQHTGAVELASSAVVRDNEVATVVGAMTVEFVSPAVVPHEDSVVLPDAMAVELASPVVVGQNDLVMKDVMAVRDFAFDNIAVSHERASSSYAGPGNASSSTQTLVDKEGYHSRETDGSVVEHSPSVPLPVLTEVPVAEEREEQVLDAAAASEALEVVTPRESPLYPGSVKLSSLLGSDGRSTIHDSEKAEQGEDYTLDEQQPAKRAKTNGAIYSGADAVAVVLGQTAEIVLVLAGMAQMRAGRIPTSYERELAAKAYQNLRILVSQVAPNNLVAKESLERMLQEYSMKKVAQKNREDHAWVEALSEAEALANARAETLERAKAEAVARAQAEVAAKAQSEAAARAQAEVVALAQAESDESRQQAAVKASITAANGPSKGQSAYRVSEVAHSASFPTPAVHPNSPAEIGSQVKSPVSKAGEIPRLVSQTEKSMSVNGHTLASKPSLRRPPKVRNRVRKEPATVTLFTPEFLNVVQGQAPDPQKAHVTHKQLCLGVQQFIREHVPPVSQNLQALPPTYISTPIPCQVCKLIAKDTGSVLVCDSCDEVSHVKCVQPSSRGASKGDWNCPKCLTATRGGKCPSKYGPIRHGSPNSVKLWPPHDISQGSPGPIRSISNGSVKGEGELVMAGRQISSGFLTVQGKAGLEIDTRAQQNMDDPSTGNFGSSPHLIVQLVNEPSPRTNHPLHSSSHSLLQGDNQGPSPSGKGVSSIVQETSSPKVLMNNVSSGDKTHLQGKTGVILSGQNDSLKIAEDDGKFGQRLEKSECRSIAVVVEDSGHEARYRRATPAQIKKTETRTQAIQIKKGNVDSGTVSQSKQAGVPLPIVMEWVGESTRKAEGKVYYRACSVGGITFSVSDCALFRPETPDVPPYIARLQVLWEDIATGHKWVRVSWCYYPTDIPLAMGRPETTAPDEVYESNHCDNNLVGSIQGPCFVLPPLKFIEETERRRALKQIGDAVEELPPIFLSRWMYDAPKGVFRPLQE